MTFPVPEFTLVQQGWQCPVCGTVNAPWAPTCLGPHHDVKITIQPDTIPFIPPGRGNTTGDPPPDQRGSTWCHSTDDH